MPTFRMRRYVALVITLPIVTGLAQAVPAAADVITFKLLTNYSQASFRSDSPLETFVGTPALEGIQGTSPRTRPSLTRPAAACAST